MLSTIIFVIFFLVIPLGTFINNVFVKDKNAIVVNIIMFLIYFACEYYMLSVIYTYNFDKTVQMKLLMEWFYRILITTSILRALYLVIIKKYSKSLFLLLYVFCILFISHIYSIIKNFASFVYYEDEQEQLNYYRNHYLSGEVLRIFLRDIYVINFFIRVWFKDKTNKKIEEKEKEESEV